MPTTRSLPGWLAAVALAAWAAPSLAQSGGGSGPCDAAPRAVEPSPEISAEELCATIAVLAADSLEGRAAGSPGAVRAAEIIAARFAAIGLVAPEGSYLQPFRFANALQRDPHHATADGDSLITTANVVGILPGADHELREEAIVVGAHYDHLGWGGWGSLAPDERAIHNGADDNASGVAGLLELAHLFARNPARRTLIFVAFGAEELGAVGSQHYVREPAWPLDRTIAMINLDMIGRLRDRITILGTGSSPAWTVLLDSIGAEPDAVASARVPDGMGPSDHASFYAAQLPVLSFFTGPHEDYHRPGDDVDRVDGEGAASVIELAASVVAAVADRATRIVFQEAPVTERRAAAFRVALGIVPDYGFGGHGVRIASVRPGGPADRAGIEVADVVVALAGRTVDDVYGYTEVLAGLEADHPVEAVVERRAEILRLTVVPEAR